MPCFTMFNFVDLCVCFELAISCLLSSIMIACSQFSTQVAIILKDVNDEEPKFISANETFVGENSPPNTLVMVVKALDMDEGRNSYVEYVLQNEKSTFNLGSADGLLRVVGNIDRETRSNYTLQVGSRFYYFPFT